MTDCITFLSHVLGDSGDADIVKEKVEKSDIDIVDNSSGSGYFEGKSERVEGLSKVKLKNSIG